ncbi:NAD(P)/FAD-dependent oxidoreductase [Pseudonocardia kujensis]|uniref:flavin-containing monooxygenase n=1 Tax=Pseudonocardia kujensis TaxID=1128675 RepID=UPI001E2AAB51|nr:NAD(P)/FAD-dependent oxidoreductase [Pseudonocardia kujensis]MCE0764564.1 NAD(P)/FAD-dependent oxidoreductase [Pseudonocardia kujensis]
MTVTEPVVDSVPSAVLDPAVLAGGWLDDLTQAIDSSDRDRLIDLLGPEIWWRDQLVLDQDVHTTRGPGAVADLVLARAGAAGFGGLALPDGAKLVDTGDGSQLVEAIFEFDTALGRGRGVVRLTSGEDGIWRAWTVLTALHELTGFEERVGRRRPVGNPHGRSGPSWPELRDREREFADRDPEVLVIGAGQSGLAIGARLVQMGVDALVIDSHPRVGDAWRNRYRSLSLHDPVWFDHMPYLNFPDTWPIYMPKDKIAGWLEYYADAMEINVWNSTTLLSADYDEQERIWTAVVRRADGSERRFRTPHIVMATGLNGRPRQPRFPGQDTFRGTVVHSSGYRGTEDVEGRTAVVVGAATSGHDISQDLYHRGARVTMVQRSSTCVISTEHGIPGLFDPLFVEGGPKTEDADLLFASYPFLLLGELHVGLTDRLRELDADLLGGLEKAGFALDYGPNGSGLFMKVLQTASGYYIDVGGSELIATGKVKVAQGAGIDRFEPDGVVLTDGRKLAADLVVLATGYDTLRDQVTSLFGPAVSGQVKDAWGLDEEGELNGTWRPTGHPGLWFLIGNLAMARYYSRILALQLTARLRGLVPA